MRSADAPVSLRAVRREGSPSRSDRTCRSSPDRMASNKGFVSAMMAPFRGETNTKGKPSCNGRKKGRTELRYPSLAAGAVLTDGFVHQGVEFRAGQGNFFRCVF